MLKWRTALLLGSCVLVGMVGDPRANSGRDTSTLRAYVPRLRRILLENIVPFWMSKSLDLKNGGYIINFGPGGEPKGPGTKMIVTQARQIWLFSHLVREGYGGRKHLDAADLGYRFLAEKMWDRKFGGFYWETDAAGNLLKPKKHLYGQAFALYALSEFYLASHRKDVLDLAVKLFNLLETHAHDKIHGGYIECFNEDWTVPPGTEISYMGVDSSLKLMNTHLHLMEALTTFYGATKLPTARERLSEMVGIQTSAVVRKEATACTDKYDVDWKPRLEGEYAIVSYGHDLENVPLVIDACEALGVSTYPFIDLYRNLWSYCLKYGYDDKSGGFFHTGHLSQYAADSRKLWWVEAEAVVSALWMYRLTGDRSYLSAFEQTFNFIESRLVDWERGEWHAMTDAQGNPQGDKATQWKAGYHNGRSMMECLRLIKEMKR